MPRAYDGSFRKEKLPSLTPEPIVRSPYKTRSQWRASGLPTNLLVDLPDVLAQPY